MRTCIFFFNISKRPSTLITYKGIKFYLENSPYVVGRTGSSRFAATCTRGPGFSHSGTARACWVSLHLTPVLRVLPLYLLVLSWGCFPSPPPSPSLRDESGAASEAWSTTSQEGSCVLQSPPFCPFPGAFWTPGGSDWPTSSSGASQCLSFANDYALLVNVSLIRQ